MSTVLSSANHRSKPVAKTYEILTPRETNRNRNLTPRAGMKAAGKEAVMLDFAFVALGFAVIGVMAFYAMALRQI